MKKKLSALFLFLLCGVMLFGSIGVFAAEPYQTYTYSINGEVLYSPAAYKPALTVDAAYMGIPGGQFGSMDDLVVGPDNKVYIADAANSTIYVLSAYYKYEFSIKTFYNGTSNDSLNGPKGVFVTDEYIYVADTENYRIVVFDTLGNFVRIIPRPQSSLFGADSTYKPVALAVDQYGRIFVISSTTYQGIIVMTEDGVFTGFIGAQKVTYNIIDIIWRNFQSEADRAAGVQYISTEYNNISIDSDGFIYATIILDSDKQQTAIEDKSADFSPIKKLNSAGEEIMKRNGFFGTGGEVTVQNLSNTDAPTGASQIRDVAIGPEMTYSIIDSKRNKIFTYDQNGNLLFAFGDFGVQLGNSVKNGLSAIAYQTSTDASANDEKQYKMLTLDTASSAKSVTVYLCTEYGSLLYDALGYENNRLYEESVVAWRAVLARNNNFDAAYIGVGKALYRAGDYEGSMEMFKAAYDTENYSTSFSEVRKEWFASSILFIPAILLVAVVVVVAIMALGRLYGYAGKYNRAVAIGEKKRSFKSELFYCFHLRFHPFDGFWDLKHEKRGSVRAALVILAVTIVCFYYQAIGTGYLLNPQETETNIFAQALGVLVPLALWVVSNWCLTTLFDGEGSLKDVLIATCYSLAPLPLFLIVSTLMSNFVTSAEAQLVSFLVVIAFVWAGFLLFFGSMVTHDYSMGKNFLMVIASIVGMLIIMFLALLFSSLIGKIVSFISNIIVEISYRV